MTGVFGRRWRASVVRTVPDPHHVQSKRHTPETADEHEDRIRAEPTVEE
jgi:aspartate aminotransferase-like enzyme